MEEAADSTQLWRLTMQHSPIGMTLAHPDGRLVAVNDSFCDMIGYDEAQLTSMRVQDITHPDDLGIDLGLMQSTLSGERASYRLRKRYLCAGERQVWGDLSVAVLRDESGEPRYFIAQVLDVTAQHDYERQIAEANATIERQGRTVQAVYDSVDVGLLLIDRSGRYERMNRRHADFIALAFPDGHHGKAGQVGLAFTPDGSRALTRDETPSYRALQGEEFDDVRIWVGEDRRRALSVSARTVHGPDGEIEGAALSYTDVTEYMRALGIKDEFVASVSHELRTPLTSVLGHLEILSSREDLPPDAGAQIDVIERNALRLDNLVADLLEVGQGSEGVLHLVRERSDVVAIAREALEAARPTADRAGIDLLMDATGPVESEVDPERMRQVLDNLLSNALKYTDEGGSVTVSVGLDGDHVEVEVADTGIGIDPADSERVFGRFFRAPAAHERMAPGTGLGLSIVRGIVKAHGGQVEVRGQVGRGTVFRVRLPRVAV